jgi:hypothetical protein
MLERGNLRGVIRATRVKFRWLRSLHAAISRGAGSSDEAALDLLRGIMYSEVNNGLASGFLHSNNIDPTVGIRFQF